MMKIKLPFKKIVRIKLPNKIDKDLKRETPKNDFFKKKKN